MVLGVRGDVEIFKLTDRAQSINSESLCTWILGVVSKQLRLLHGRVGASKVYGLKEEHATQIPTKNEYSFKGL